MAAKLFKQENGEPIVLDDYQIKIIDSALELFPDNYKHAHLRGMLRFRQAIVSIPRRNGKSLIASVLTTYSLVMSTAPNMGVLASTMNQATIVHNATKFNFMNIPALKARFKVTGHRGIESRRADKPAHFKIHAGDGDSLQGIGFSGYVPIVVDELHLTKPEAYDAAVKGASTCPSAVVIGITTAGTEESKLLKRLYLRGQQAIANPEDDERFGFWHWRVADDAGMWDREALLRANPAAQVGRIDIDEEIKEGKANPAGDYAEFRRYRRNEFIHSEDPWLSIDMWATCNGNGIPVDYKGNRVFAIDKTQGWEFATITAAVKIDEVIYTERVCRIHNASLEYLEQVCVYLYNRFGAEMFVANNLALRDLIINLREQHYLPGEYLTEAQLANATVTASSLVANKRLVHKTDPLIKQQLPKTVVVQSTEGVKVSIKDSPGAIDAVRSTIMAVYQAEKMEPQSFNLIIV